jgi:ubiquinone/menaquinone biosynthesis C-methylase UbiE
MTMTRMRMSGTQETRRFYNETGWKQQNGASVDHNLFGATEDGPIRVELHQLHNGRIRSALTSAGIPLNLLECGCGGNPERLFLDLCSKYTAVDFSDIGVDVARTAFAGIDLPHDFQTADVCALPFHDNAFDAVYCAHMIYHIEDPAAQETAIAELIRVVRPGGIVLLVAANPRPLAFPVRLIRRLVADTPVIGPILNRMRSKPPLPYKPMPIGWVRRRLARGGAVEILGIGIPTTSFYRNVTEFKGLGKLLWRAIRWMDVNYPRLSAKVGNYVLLVCRKESAATPPANRV